VELEASGARLAARGRRGLLISPAHIGNWALLAAALRRRGLDGAVVGRRRRDDPSSDWLIEMRRAYGVTTIAQDERPRQLVELLRSGKTLGILCDLAVKQLDGEELPFFGLPAMTMTAPAALARAAHLPLVPVRCVARGERYVLSAEEPLHLDRDLARRDRGAATRELLTRMNAVFERWIRETPEQWAWHQRRWGGSTSTRSSTSSISNSRNP
jgi:KDO2-lipid IV(A) lauroyltransferase